MENGVTSGLSLKIAAMAQSHMKSDVRESLVESSMLVTKVVHGQRNVCHRRVNREPKHHLASLQQAKVKYLYE